MMDDSHHELLAQIASMYYEQSMTQNAIASQLDLSRVKVYRLLKEARAEQIVQVTISWPIKRDNQLEESLKGRFGLKDALVLKTTPHHDPSLALQRLGQLGARYLEQVLNDGTTLAVCLGRSTYEVINAIRPSFHAKVRVAQAIGSMPFAMGELDSAALARELARKLGGDVLYLSSPVMADSSEAADVLRSQQGIDRTLRAARAADVALIGIGNLDPTTSGFVKAGFITPDELTQLTADGAVGDVAGQIFSLAGDLHPCEFNQRIIGVTFQELCKIPTTIAVAMGREKTRAILGGLRTCTFNVLCTDDQAASEVLHLDRG
jgi:DNA-binding transcriptional regulator LsrR (DeoR family)